jgi:hypothetical protein
VAIQTVYYRHKTESGSWRYSALGPGRRAEAAKHGPYFIRVRNVAGRCQWQKHDTNDDAEKAAKLAPMAHKAQELGLTLDEVTNVANANRVSIKTAVENYLHERRFGRPRSIKVYETVFDQLLVNLPGSVRFIDQLCFGLLSDL